MRDEINPGMSLLPAPAPSDVEGTVAGNPIVRDRQALVDTLEKQIEELKKKSAEFESYASGDRKPPSVRPRSDPGSPPLSSSSGGNKGRRDRADDFEREVEQITRRTEATKAATAAQAGINPLLRDFGEAAAVAAARTDLLLAAQQAGLTITPELAAKVETLATAYGSAEASAARLDDQHRNMERSAEEWTSLRQDATKGLISNLMDGTSAADAFANALGRIGDKLLDIALNNAFGGGGAGPLSGGLLGGKIIPGILHSGGVAGRDGYGHGRAYPAAMWANAKRYHNGGEVPALLLPGERVLNRQETAAYDRGGGVVVNIHNAPPGTKVEERAGPGGTRQIEVMLRDAVKGMLSDGTLDKTMGANYGLSRNGRR